MKVTFLLPAFPRRPSGGHRVVYEYANHLVARGHQVTAVHPQRLPKQMQDPPPPPPNLYRWLRGKGAQWRERLLPYRITWQTIDPRVEMAIIPDPSARYLPDADVVFATWWGTAEYVIDYPSCKGRKFYLVQDFGSYTGPEERVRATWRLPFYKVTDSNWLYEQVCEAGGAPADTLNIPIAIDHQRFRLTADVARRPKKVTMLYGTLGYKTPEVGIRALEIARQRHPEVKVAVFGQKTFKPKNLPSWASYHSNISEKSLVAIYNSSLIFLCSSEAEGFALPPAEAMACGCAVVSTDCGGNREYARHGETALLSPPGDAEALAANLLRVLEDDGLRLRLALEGHKQIQAFTWERSTNLLEEFIKSK
jgi:glycosyltransferase involved in cell wall biosynthesis